MTKQEYEKAVEEYAESLKSIAFENLSGEETPYLLRGAFKEGLESANRYWQEKTRWKSLLTEPPSEYRYDKMYLLRTESGSPYLVPLPYKESVKELLDNGFIEWKEIE